VNEFWVNFLANLLADALLAIAVYYAITQPDEKKAKQTQIKQALGLLRIELQTNRLRAEKYIQALDDQDPDLSVLFPLRFTRGAWNAVKESNLLPKLNDARLIYYLLRMNESALVANKNLRRLQLSYLEDTGADQLLLAETAKKDCEHFLEILLQVLSILDQMALPTFTADELVDEPDSATEMALTSDALKEKASTDSEPQ
jgi:hypothetical protein